MEEKERNKKAASSKLSTGSKIRGKSISIHYFETERIKLAMTAANFKKYSIELVKNGPSLSVFYSSIVIGLIWEMAAKVKVSLGPIY